VKVLSGTVAAAWLACGLAIGAQAPAEQKADQKSDAAAVTIAGCVQQEASVLKSGAPAQPGMGGGDEFVLTRASLNKGGASADKPTEPEPPAAPVGTSGSLGKVYRVTGDKEKDLKANVGQRVEITGTFKDEADAKAGAASGDPTAANTPEITILSIRPVPGSCGAGGR
jgi:hypothetical protein